MYLSAKNVKVSCGSGRVKSIKFFNECSTTLVPWQTKLNVVNISFNVAAVERYIAT